MGIKKECVGISKMEIKNESGGIDEMGIKKECGIIIEMGNSHGNSKLSEKDQGFAFYASKKLAIIMYHNPRNSLD